MKKNKIIVVISADEKERRSMIQTLAVRMGLAVTNGDANKLIKVSVYDYDLSSTYAVLCSYYPLRESPVTTNKLYQLAAHGVAVIIGSKKLQSEFEFCCEIYYPSDFDRLNRSKS